MSPNNWKGTVIDVTGCEAYSRPITGKIVNFHLGKLNNVWSITSGSLAISKENVNSGHLFVAIF